MVRPTHSARDPQDPHWSTDIPSTRRIRARRARRDRLRRARRLERRSPRPSTWTSSTWIGRAAGHQLRSNRDRRRELDCRGFWKPGDERADRGGRWTVNAQHCRASSRRCRRWTPTSAGAGHQARAPDYEDALRHIHRDDTTASTPTGTVGGPLVDRAHDNPESFMVLMEQGPDGLPTRAPRRTCRCTAAPLRRGHAAALARRAHPGTQTATR